MNQSQVVQMEQNVYAFCTKHGMVIDRFCVSHNMPLCQRCLSEHLYQYNGNSYSNATTDPLGHNNGQPPASQTGACDIKPMDQAIKESISRMHVSLRSVQEFIKKKESIDHQIQDPSMRSMYCDQNRIFEGSYNVAHDLLTRLQAMPKGSGQQEQCLGPYNMRFTEQFLRL